MSIDIFGRTLIKTKEVWQGPVRIVFTLTKDGDFNIKEHRLRNVASAIEPSDAANLGNLKSLEEKVIKTLRETEEKFLKKINSLKSKIQEKTVYVKDFTIKHDGKKNNR